MYYEPLYGRYIRETGDFCEYCGEEIEGNPEYHVCEGAELPEQLPPHFMRTWDLEREGVEEEEFEEIMKHKRS